MPPERSPPSSTTIDLVKQEMMFWFEAELRRREKAFAAAMDEAAAAQRLVQSAAEAERRQHAASIAAIDADHAGALQRARDDASAEAARHRAELARIEHDGARDRRSFEALLANRMQTTLDERIGPLRSMAAACEQELEAAIRDADRREEISEPPVHIVKQQLDQILHESRSAKAELVSLTTQVEAIEALRAAARRDLESRDLERQADLAAFNATLARTTAAADAAIAAERTKLQAAIDERDASRSSAAATTERLYAANEALAVERSRHEGVAARFADLTRHAQAQGEVAAASERALTDAQAQAGALAAELAWARAELGQADSERSASEATIREHRAALRAGEARHLQALAALEAQLADRDADLAAIRRRYDALHRRADHVSALAQRPAVGKASAADEGAPNRSPPKASDRRRPQPAQSATIAVRRSIK